MLVFIDESGDPGRKKGSSPYFTIALVAFEENDEANACDQRIELLRRELNKPGMEFHFKHNSEKIRTAFLDAVSPYSFFYYGIVINKDPSKLTGPGFADKHSFYKYACRLVFENAKEKLTDAIVVIDRSGSLEFKQQLEKYLRAKIGINGNRRQLIRKIKMQRSSSNNLLQLADYIAGAINRSVQGKRKRSDEYRKRIAHREIYVQIWPK